MTFSSYVSNSFSLEFGFHNFIQCNDTVRSAIVSSADAMAQAYKDGALDEVAIPKVFADVFESLAGAVLVDTGFDVPTALKVFLNLMSVHLETVRISPFYN